MQLRVLVRNFAEMGWYVLVYEEWERWMNPKS